MQVDNMQIGTLVKHIEWEAVGVALQQGVSTCDRWLIHFSDGDGHQQIWWCSECELEVLCK